MIHASAPNTKTVHAARWAAARLLAALCLAGSLAPTRASAQEPAHASDDEEDEDAAPMCDTSLRLSGALYNAMRPERSMAVLQVDSKHPGSVYRVGTWVSGYELVTVAPRGALLRNDDGECWLQLVGDGSPRSAPAPRPKKAQDRGKKKKGKKKPDKHSEVAVIGGR